MEDIKKSKFKFEQFIVQEFKIVREPKKPGKLQINIEPSGVVDYKECTFILSLEVNLKDDKASFDIDISALGIFKFDKQKNKSDLTNYFLTNAPAIVFPYIRAYVSGVTALSGLDAINLPAMNLTYLRDKLKENIADKTEE